MRVGNRFWDTQRVRLDGLDCVYCGEPANAREHFPPATYGAWGFILPSCGECNSLANTEHPLDWGARVDHVKAGLRRKGQRLLDTPDWSAEEIKELGPIMRGEATRWQRRKRRLQQRLAWNADVYIASIDPFSDFVPNPVARESITSNEKQTQPQDVRAERLRRLKQRAEMRKWQGKLRDQS